MFKVQGSMFNVVIAAFQSFHRFAKFQSFHAQRRFNVQSSREEQLRGNFHASRIIERPNASAIYPEVAKWSGSDAE
jgi:hypothetical protein